MLSIKLIKKKQKWRNFKNLCNNVNRKVISKEIHLSKYRVNNLELREN
jgi:hypothetical protein